MLSRLRRISTVNEKAVVETTTRELTPPPSYSSCDEPTEAPPDLAAAFSNLDLSPSQMPTPDLALAHLKLLEAFYQLREDISQRDGLFGIKDEFIGETNGGDNERNRCLAQVREKRWAIYVSKAVGRFEQWWRHSVETSSTYTQTQWALCGRSAEPRRYDALTFTRDQLPPLDVIMVWHAYQLNPRTFLSDCMRHGKGRLWKTGLPWAAIIPCIDNSTFEFIGSDDAQALFESQTHHRWDSLQDPPHAILQCPSCKLNCKIPWTGWNESAAWAKTATNAFVGERTARGFTDTWFNHVCKCKYEFSHNSLQVMKFRNDLRALNEKGVPMLGTVLGSTGVPDQQTPSKASNFFPNRLLKGSVDAATLRDSIFEKTDPNKKSSPRADMQAIKVLIEAALKDRGYVKKINSDNVSTSSERMAVRRMMSCYWQNSSPFGLDLVGAVIRQGSFIEKMHKIDWIHSPAAAFTMGRLIEKYGRYLNLVAVCPPKQVAVPTLDVDLAWHTHQLQPSTYYAHTVATLSKYLDHDDKIEDTLLAKGFEWISKEYQKRYGELYSECSCWYCEAVRESFAPKIDVAGSLKRRFSGGQPVNEIEKQLRQLHSSTDPKSESAHISAHNAMKPSTKEDRALRERNVKIKLERDYQRAVQRAKRRGYDPPRRDEYLYIYAYPVYMPPYVPYEGDPCITGGMYPTNPSCASFVAGAEGNCAAGSCGGAVAAGACGFGGSCAGGSVGGCTSEGGSGDGGGCSGCSGCGGCGGCG